MKRILVSFFFLSIFRLSIAQQHEHTDYVFINYLIKNNEYREAIYLLKKALETGESDSANFILGWSFYELKELDSSTKYLSKVTDQSDLYLKSRFFAGYNQIYLGNYLLAKNLFGFNTDDQLLTELKTLELAGMSLLERDFAQYEKYASGFALQHYALEKEERKLVEIYDQMRSFNPKSRGVAVALSTIVPGAGKMYVGKWGEGMVNLITVGSLAAITMENYNKDGLDYKTIIFGALGSIYYFGNIWGAYHSVSFYRQEFYEQVDYQILYHIHIPLRNVFN